MPARAGLERLPQGAAEVGVAVGRDEPDDGRRSGAVEQPGREVARRQTDLDRLDGDALGLEVRDEGVTLGGDSTAAPERSTSQAAAASRPGATRGEVGTEPAAAADPSRAVAHDEASWSAVWDRPPLTSGSMPVRGLQRP